MPYDPLFQNAINAIKLAIEDYQKAFVDNKRYLSAIRNLHVGILLLLKEELRRLSPVNSNDVLIMKNMEMKYDPSSGQIICVGKGRNTIGYQEAVERLELMGKPLSSSTMSAIRNLEKERNSIEHKYSTTSQNMMDSIISDATIAIAELLGEKYLSEPPADCLDDETWIEMQHITELYNKMKRDYEEELKKLNTVKQIDPRLFNFLRNGFFCSNCATDFFRIDFGKNGSVVFHCLGCGSEISWNEMLVCFSTWKNANLAILEDSLKEEYTFSMLDKIYNGKEDCLTKCPKCGRNTYVHTDKESGCKNPDCGCVFEYTECSLCGTRLEIYELEEASENGGLCSACLHNQEKDTLDDLDFDD